MVRNTTSGALIASVRAKFLANEAPARKLTYRRHSQLRCFSGLRRRNRGQGRGLFGIIHTRNSVFFQLAQALFFLLLLLRKILLALLILVVRLCQFVILPVDRLDR